MDLKKRFEQKKKQEQERKEGARKFVQFLEKVLNKTGLQNPEDFCKKLSSISLDKLLNEFERINGVLRQIPIKNRKAFDTDNVVQNQFFFETANELVPPTNDRRLELLEEMLDDLQNVLKEDQENRFEEKIENPESPEQIAARSLYNAVIYLHPFSDGNGRTARTIYFELSPHVQDKSLDHLHELLLERPKSLDKFHKLLNQGALEMMLDEHKVDWKAEDELIIPFFNTPNPNTGFDENKLQFITAYDVMTEPQRERYLTFEENQAVINKDQLPEEVKEKINSHHEDVREEFVRRVLNFSTYPEKWGDWLQAPLDNSFNTKNKSD